MPHLVLVPLDGSLLAERALPYAVALARERRRRLLLLRVLQPTPARGMPLVQEPTAQAQLEKTAGQLRVNGLEVDTLVSSTLLGHTAEVIVDVARQRACDLIILSSHGRAAPGRAGCTAASPRRPCAHRLSPSSSCRPRASGSGCLADPCASSCRWTAPPWPTRPSSQCWPASETSPTRWSCCVCCPTAAPRRQSTCLQILQGSSALRSATWSVWRVACAPPVCARPCRRLLAALAASSPASRATRTWTLSPWQPTGDQAWLGSCLGAPRRKPCTVLRCPGCCFDRRHWSNPRGRRPGWTSSRNLTGRSGCWLRST
jgi:nucleotide-binding universal stress UspA family protein